MGYRVFEVDKDCTAILDQIGEVGYDGVIITVYKSDLSDNQIRALINSHNGRPPSREHPIAPFYRQLKQADQDWLTLNAKQKDEAMRCCVQSVLLLIQREVRDIE